MATRKKATKKKTAKKATAKEKAEAKAVMASIRKAKRVADSPAKLAKLAMEGDVETLSSLATYETDDDSDELAYKWLLVAADFGHDEADEWLDTLQETSSLRYDDDQFCTGNAHWELGVAYLAGGDGLPRDHARARAHFTEARERGYPHSVTGSAKMLADARKVGGADGRAIVDAIFK